MLCLGALFLCFQVFCIHLTNFVPVSIDPAQLASCLAQFCTDTYAVTAEDES